MTWSSPSSRSSVDGAGPVVSLPGGDRKFVVITSIFEPNEAVRRWAELEGWQLVVVGDRKTPPDWSAEGVSYLGPDTHADIGIALSEKLPWNHYCRKMIGYLFAIRSGATLIVDTDDDNCPVQGWSPLPAHGTFDTVTTSGFINVYRYFTRAPIWPRGYPLRQISEKEVPHALASVWSRIGIWQFLANGNPDVDAIYRLVSDRDVTFDPREPVVLGKGAVCPFNSQNTLFTPETFPLLYLPAFVTFRFTDILRGIVAQPLLWSIDKRLGFGPATVVQERNNHDYMEDFRSEIPMYLQTEDALTAAREAVDPAADLAQNLRRIYRSLCERDIVTNDEIELVDLWLDDLARVTAPSGVSEFRPLESTEVAA